jgi:hypothetical protein
VPISEKPITAGGAEQRAVLGVTGMISQPFSEPPTAFSNPARYVVQGIHRKVHLISRFAI